MLSYKLCRQCCINQIKRLAVMLETDPTPVVDIIEKEFKKNKIATAPEYAELIFKVFRNITGISDPYKEIKKHSSNEAKKLLPKVKAQVESRFSGIEKYIELAVVGNMIDYGAFHEVDIESFIKSALKQKYHKKDIESFKKDIKEAKTILYIADNAGEILFDMLFIEKLKEMKKKIVLALRGDSIINDLSYKDGLEMGLDKSVELISTELAIPGVVTRRSSKKFLHTLHDSDLVIAKGQGNFETLFVDPSKPKKLYYIFVVKCQPVAELIKAEVGNKVLMSAF